MTVLDDLIQIGFKPITEWTLKGDKIKPVPIKWHSHSCWLYAFTVDGEVRYIGLSDRVLQSRLDDYSYIRNSQTTRLRKLIQAELQAAHSVQIYGCKQPDKAVLIAEEERLRARYRPPWNRV